MKIGVLAHGSRGDVQPPMVLARRLLEEGHEVTFVVPDEFVAVASNIGVRALGIPVPVRSVLDSQSMHRSLVRGRTIAFFREAFERERHRMLHVAGRLRELTEGQALLIVPALLEDLCLCLAEARGQRVALAFPSPIWSTASYGHMLLADLPIPRWLNLASHSIMELGSRQLMPMINAFRVELGLPVVTTRPSFPFRRSAPPVFYWVPPEVLPPPSDYGANHHFTGYWAAPQVVRQALGEARPSDRLRRFVDAGPPPIFVGFGSMPVLDERVVEVVDRVTARLGRRVVFGGGWSKVEERYGERTCFVESVDHEWLFPRCAAVVHHGGASTTGAAIRAGTPAVVVSVFADQPFWGQRVAELGVGESFRFQRLSEARLERALTRALQPATRARARVLAEELAARTDGAVWAARHVSLHGSRYPVPRGLT